MISRACIAFTLLAAALGLGRAEAPRDAAHPDAKSESAEIRASRVTDSVARQLPRLGSTEGAVARRNFIDTRLFAAMERDGIPHAPLSNDYEFGRRVHLDLTGRIPTIERLRQFVEDSGPDKRDRLIDELLESQAWVDHWAYWFGDLVRNCGNRIGDPTTQNFDGWIRASLKADKPYDQFVTEMLTVSAPNSVWLPDAAPAGFLARWHVAGDTMYSDRHEDTSDEIAVQTARVFLGVNYQCISCHGGKGFLEKVDVDLISKSRSDLWAMAAFFGKTRVQIVPFQDRFTITDDGSGYDATAPSSVRLQRRGTEVQPAFMLTGEKADPAKPLRPQFARMLTTHPQFARASVNWFWKELFGLGLVEPVDAFDLARQDPANPPPAPWTIQPLNPGLLDELARDFSSHGFSLRHLMRRLAQSSAYQLSARFDGEWKASYTPYFARRYIRQLTAEQLHDAICQATQVFGNYRYRDMAYGTERPPIRFWTQAASPENISGEAKAFLQTFGQANREQFDRQPGGSILQALMLMNNPFVTRRARAENGSTVEQLVKSDRSGEAIVEALYLSTLSRPPLPAERALAASWIEQDRQTGVEDLQWALLNKLDFVFNY